MNTPSRLPPVPGPEPLSLISRVVRYVLFVGIAAGFIYAIWSKQGMLGFCLGLICLVAFMQWKGNQALKKLAVGREDENIYTFTDGFDQEKVDPLIISSVYEALQVYVRFPGGVCPLRASDRLNDDLNIDPDDIDDLFFEIAQRLGRSIKDMESNLYYENMNTVGSLVLFINSQPRVVREAQVS